MYELAYELIGFSKRRGTYECAHDGGSERSRLVRAAPHVSSENMGVTGRTKHFVDNIHYVRQLYDYGKIYIVHVRTHLQRADGFTKPLDKLLYIPWRSTLIE